MTIDIIDSTTGEAVEADIETAFVAQRVLDAIQRHAIRPHHLALKED